MARRHTEPTGSLDSLLDTMANVVGILVFVLALMQISVGEAVDRIRFEKQAELPTPEEVELAAERVQSMRERVEELEGEWAGLEPEATQVRTELQKLEERLGPIAGPAKVADRLSGRQRALTDLESEVERARGELARVELVLTDERDETAPTETIVRLPDPHPPPPGARAINFFCRYDRIFAVDLDTLFRLLHRERRAAIGAAAWEQIHPLDYPRLIEHFSVNFIGADGFRWRLRERFGRAPDAVLEWTRKAVGETEREILRPGSRYRSVLNRYHSANRYVHFYAWGDSFEVYLEARQFAEGKGFAVGWRPFPEDYEPTVGPGGPDLVD